jgi:hypothetical protein
MAQLRTLKLEGMACALQDQLTQAGMTAMSFEERLTMRKRPAIPSGFSISAFS